LTGRTTAILNKVSNHAKAWSAHDAQAVAAAYVPEIEMVINRGDAINGRTEVAEMAAGFCAEFPDLALTCTASGIAGDQVVYLWRLTGHHVETGNFVDITGWEQWTLNEALQVTHSLGWYDAEDYTDQIGAAVEPE
jgi:uncharacterized protein (TIGR02246 family)